MPSSLRNPITTDHIHHFTRLAKKELVEEHLEWSENTPAVHFQGRLSAEILDKFPVYHRFECDTSGTLIMPSESNVLLSDEIV